MMHQSKHLWFYKISKTWVGQRTLWGRRFPCNDLIINDCGGDGHQADATPSPIKLLKSSNAKTDAFVASKGTGTSVGTFLHHKFDLKTCGLDFCCGSYEVFLCWAWHIINIGIGTWFSTVAHMIVRCKAHLLKKI